MHKMKRAGPEPAPTELPVGGRADRSQATTVQGRGCCARRKVSGEPGNSRAASLPAVRPQPSAPWGVTRAPGRSTSMGSKARLRGRRPQPPLSLTHGTVQINSPGSPRISWQQRTCASSGSTLLCPSNPDTCGHAGTGLEREPDCACACARRGGGDLRGPASGGQEKSPASNSWEKESSASAVSLLPPSFTFLGPHSLPSSVRL